MNRIIKSIAAIAVAVFSFSACQEEIEAPQATHTVSFLAGSVDVDTKTSATIEGSKVKYSWEDADEQSEGTPEKFHVYENGVEATSIEAVLDGEVMMITANFPGEIAPTDPAYTCHFNSAVLSKQTSVGEGYDQSSDVLIAKENDSEAGDASLFTFAFKREVAFAQATLKNLEKGVKVSKVTVESTDGTVLAADYDFENKRFNTVGSTSITIDCQDITISEGQALITFVTVPVNSASLKMKVVTVDEQGNYAGTYTKTFARELSLTRGDVKGFGVALEPLNFVENFNSTGCTTDASKEYGSTNSFSDTYTAGFDYTWTAGSGSQNIFDGGIKLGSGSKGGGVTSSDILNDISNGTNFTVAVYASGWDDNMDLTVSYNNKDLTYTTKQAIAKPNDKTYSSSDFAQPIEYVFQKTDATDLKISVATGVRVIIDKVVIKDGGELPSAYSIFVANNIQNGSVSANPSSDVMPGAEITLTATPEDGYELESWDVTNASTSEQITVTDDKFTMPSANVNVSATFKEASKNNSVTINTVNSGVTGSYADKTFTVDGLTFGFTQWMKSTNIQAKKSTTNSLYNITAFPVPIKKITIVQTGTARAITVYGGTSSKPTTEIVAPDTGLTMEFDFSEYDYTYFSLTTPGNAVYFDSITIEYEEPAALSSIEVSGTPNKKEYFADDSFVVEGLVATGTYSDNSTKVITDKVDWTVTPSVLTAGLTSVKVVAKLGEVVSPEYDVNGITVSVPLVLQKIEVTGTPAELWKGDAFNHDGIKVTASWSDNTTSDVTADCEFSGYDMSTAGTQNVTVSYEKKTCSYSINVRTIANTQETAYTASEAKALIDKGKDLSTGVYVKGTISKIVSAYNSEYGNISFNVSADGTENGDQFQFFRNFRGVDKDKWTDTDVKPAVGDKVVGYGTLTKYNSTYEFAEGNYIVSNEKAPYLKATASKTSGILAAGETITVTVDTNVEGWLVSSDNAAFQITAKSATSFNVVVSENTSTTDSRTAKITVSAAGVPDAIIDLSQTYAGGGTEQVYKTALFGSAADSGTSSGYTTTYTSTTKGFSVEVANGNTNATNWAMVKFGRKGNASVGSITTSDAIDKAVTKVVIDIDAITATNVNSITLYSGTDADSCTTSEGTFSTSTGKQTVTISSPAANKFYKVVFDCKSGSGNGFVAVKTVEYYAVY